MILALTMACVLSSDSTELLAKQLEQSPRYDEELEEAVLDSAFYYIIGRDSGKPVPEPSFGEYLKPGWRDVVPEYFRGFCLMWAGWREVDNERMIDGLKQIFSSKPEPSDARYWSLVNHLLDTMLTTANRKQVEQVINIIDRAGDQAAPLRKKKELFEGKIIMIDRGLD